MARDYTKNAYFMVGIPRESATYDALCADAGETGLSLPQLIATRIADWYRLEAGHPLPTARARVAADRPGGSFPEGTDPTTDDLEVRAAEAAAAWATFDEE